MQGRCARTLRPRIDRSRRTLDRDSSAEEWHEPYGILKIHGTCRPGERRSLSNQPKSSPGSAMTAPERVK